MQHNCTASGFQCDWLGLGLWVGLCLLPICCAPLLLDSGGLLADVPTGLSRLNLVCAGLVSLAFLGLFPVMWADCLAEMFSGLFRAYFGVI